MNPSLATRDRNLRVATLALERGWIDRATFEAALARLDDFPVELLWKRQGVLTDDRRFEIHRLLSLPESSQPHGPETDEERAADTDPPLPQGSTSAPVPPSTGGELTNVFRPRFRIPDRSAPWRGGIGQVFVGRDTEIPREVAVKELLPRYCDVLYYRQRLIHEARMLGKLGHHGVPQVYGQGCYAAGDPYYAMQLLKGETLKQAIDAFHTDVAGSESPSQTQIVQFKKLLNWFCEVCESIRDTHHKGIVHLDLKPANVILHEGKHAYVADWGMAQELDDKGRIDWDEGSPGGTTAFMSPEVARDDRAAVGVASDVFSLGATLFYLLTGKPLYAGGTTEEVREQAREAVVNPDAKPLPFAPEQLMTICRKATSPQVADRFASAGKLADAVAEVSDLVRGKVARLSDLPLSPSPGTKTDDFGTILRELRDLRGLALPDLRGQWEDLQKELLEAARPGSAGEGQRQAVCERVETQLARVALALFVVDRPGRAGWLELIQRHLLSKPDPRELLLLREGLREHATRDELGQLGKALHASAESVVTRQERKKKRFRALVALAGLPDVPNNPWSHPQSAAEAGRAVVEFLFQDDRYGRPWISGLTLPDWTLALEPVKHCLLEPLTEVFRDDAKPDHVWVKAGELLLRYLPDEPRKLCDLITSVDVRRGAVLWGKLSALLPDIPSLLRKLTAERRVTPEATARLRAYVAIALLERDRAEPVWPLYDDCRDPGLLNYLIHLPDLCGLSPDVLADRFGHPGAPVSIALVLALGDYHDNEEMDWIISNPAFRDRLRDLYHHAPDAGLHSAVGWMLTAFADGDHPPDLALIDEQLRQDHPAVCERPPARDWYVNGQGQTFAVIAPPTDGIFLMGTPDAEPERDPDERQHERGLSHRFALGTRPISAGEFAAFVSRQLHFASFPDLSNAPPDWPAFNVTWYQAAAYCNWLSHVDGVPESQWCYEAVGGRFADGMSIRADWQRLTGYRLPSEAEWEYACRAGTLTARYWGDLEELMDQYAWYRRNANHTRHRVGRLKPNAFGLFDTLGNVWEWCLDRYRPYGSYPTEEPGGEVREKEDRVLRGGAAHVAAADVRAGRRLHHRPGGVRDTFGFRVCRTWVEQG